MSYKESKDNSGCYKEWRDDRGKLHRDFGPAQMSYDLRGVLIQEVFWFHGKIHRDFGPASIDRYLDGSIRMEQFWFHGDPHRELGPAWTTYNRDGSPNMESFWLHGKNLGYNREGFWALWDNLTDERRQDHNLLKCLARYL